MNEPLNEEDLDWLTRAENRIYRMQAREASHISHSLISGDLDDEGTSFTGFDR